MALKYSDAEIAVFHGIFRGLRVRNLRTGNVVIPNLDLKARTLWTWSALPKVRFTSSRARIEAEKLLFRDCGRLALNPNDDRAFDLAFLSGQVLLDHYRMGGEWAAFGAETERMEKKP